MVNEAFKAKEWLARQISPKLSHSEFISSRVQHGIVTRRGGRKTCTVYYRSPRYNQNCRAVVATRLQESLSSLRMSSLSVNGAGKRKGFSSGGHTQAEALVNYTRKNLRMRHPWSGDVGVGVLGRQGATRRRKRISQ